MTDLQRKMAEKLGLSTEDFQPKKATKVDELEAQVLYTALMTDTLIEESDDNVQKSQTFVRLRVVHG